MNNYRSPKNRKKSYSDEPKFLSKTVIDRASIITAIITVFATLVVAIMQFFIPKYLPYIGPTPFVSATIYITPLPISTFTPSPTPTPTKPNPIVSITPNATPNLGEIQLEISQLRTEVKSLQQQLDALNQKPSNAAQLAEINNKIAPIDKRLADLEQIILDNPSKALSLVLINKDIDTIQQRQETDLQALRDEISRVYGLNQWFLGILIPMAISVVGLTIRNLLSERESKGSTENNKNISSPSNNETKE
jgi:hypothetical protein